jgi:adenylate cyclase
VARIIEMLKALFALARSGGMTGALPARVVAEIDRREAAGERLVGWVQLALVVTFGTLYALSPRAEGSSNTSFTSTVLVIYFVFTLFRVWLSYRRVLPTWYLVISIIADVGLLCALIYSFHIQYNQPAAFYLKAPTMIYLFIFISVRALRFDPRFVLLTGLMAAVGWFALVIYALNTDMGQMRITRNYVDYMTSNSILIGAEIDRGIAILGVTFVLTLALYRARAVLIDAISSHTAASDLAQFFSPQVAASITKADSLPAAQMSKTREAAILVVDLRSFTATAAKLPAETVMTVLGLYQDAAVRVIEAHDGQIDKFMGDGILATFGAVEDSETHAADALRAAVALTLAIDAIEPAVRAAGWSGPFQAGIAVSSGLVTVGVVGGQSRLEFTVIGNAVNTAAKLEAANKVEGTRVLTDAATFDRAVAQGHDLPAVEMRPGRHISGLAKPVDLVVLA